MDDFDEFVCARWSALTRTAYLLVGDSQLAEDLVQEALTSAAARWSKVVRGGDPEPYVRRSMYHLSIDWWRRGRWRESPHDAALDMSRPDRRVGAEDDAAVSRLMLRTALSRLTAKQRAVLVLRFYEDLTEVETAKALGCSVNTVKSQCRYALERLRQVAPDLIEPLAMSTSKEGK